MGNARGTKNSRNHETLNPDDSVDRFQFFDFSYEEIGIYDVAASVDYILEATGQSGLHYVGHSQGCTVFLVLASMRAEYNDKFKSVHLMAPVGYQSHFPDKSLAALSKLTDVIYVSYLVPITIKTKNTNNSTEQSYYINNCFLKSFQISNMLSVTTSWIYIHTTHALSPKG
jgi:lysosomal acid lipase/cholesteryl ester hydrolase